MSEATIFLVKGSNVLFFLVMIVLAGRAKFKREAREKEEKENQIRALKAQGGSDAGQ